MPFGCWGDQEFFVGAGMRAMTGDTVTGTHRAVSVFFAENVFLMTIEAEAAYLLTVATELKTHFGLMWVMAVGTSLFHRRVYHRKFEFIFLLLMTDKAEF